MKKAGVGRLGAGTLGNERRSLDRWKRPLYRAEWMEMTTDWAKMPCARKDEGALHDADLHRLFGSGRHVCGAVSHGWI